MSDPRDLEKVDELAFRVGYSIESYVIAEVDLVQTLMRTATKTGEMGDALLAVDLGTVPAVSRVDDGGGHTCVLFVDGRLKCWGSNTSGQLGLGDGIFLRDEWAGGMGDELPFVRVGQ